MTDEIAVIVRPRFGMIEVSASITETHTRESEISEHALERGASVIDHRRKRPITLDMEAIIGEPTTRAEKEQRDPANDMIQRDYDALVTMFESGEYFQMVTDFAVYDQMIFKRLSVQRDARTGNAIRFSAALAEVRFADSEVVEVKSLEVDKPKTAPKVDQGKKATTAATPEVAEKQTVLRQLKNPAVNAYEAISGFLGGF